MLVGSGVKGNVALPLSPATVPSDNTEVPPVKRKLYGRDRTVKPGEVSSTR